jgi:hypothetical protein
MGLEQAVSRGRHGLPARRWLSAAIFVLAYVWTCGGPRADELSQTPPWMIGIYGGALTHEAFASIFYQPQKWSFSPSYLVESNLTYRLYKMPTLPLQFDLDMDAGKRFGQAHQWDFGIVPMARWMSFPWNKYLYTNLRIGAGGVSYVTGISQWELQNSENDKGSRFLHFLVTELTFSSGPDANWEAFIRVHHRSGIYGMINGVYGGSSYVTAGYRAHW